MKKFLLSGIILLIGSVLGVSAQNIRINGKVVSSKDGSELPGVNIQIKGTSQGTITDAMGTFDLSVRSASDTLIFSFIGFVTKQEVVGQRSTINIQLTPDATELDEVVITGFQDIEKKLFTGSSVNLKMADLRISGMTNAGQMLEGRVAGVTVDNVSGTFGTNPKIRIRGNTSINGDTQPLIVVDNVILEDLSNVSADDIVTGNANTLTASSIAGLNPDDIQSYQILKDASATALYGTRAKNGVIVITTKKGRSGETRISYSANYSLHLRPSYRQFDIMNSVDEMSVYREMDEKGLIDIATSVRAQNYGSLGKMYALISEHELNWGPGMTRNEEFLNQYETANTDWFDILFKDLSLQQQHSLSLTSGTEKHNSYYSLSFLNDNGQTIADNVKRYSGTARNSFQLTRKLTVDLKLTGNYRNQQVPGTQNRDFDPLTGRFRRDFDINPLSYALNTSRAIRPYDENGNLEYFRRNFAPFNILEELKLNYINIDVGDISTQADVTYSLLDNLSVRSTLQGRYATTKREHVIHERSNQAEAYRADDTQYIQEANRLLYPDPNDPSALPKVVLPEGGFNNVDEDELKYFYVRNSIDWSHTINSIHNITVLAGQEIKYTNRVSRKMDGIGVVYENGGVVRTDPLMIDFLNRQGVSIFELRADRERFAGFFLNGAYSFKGRYIFNGTVRYDGSNRLGNSNAARYLPTWNISGAWNLDQESFFDVSWVNQLKLRATYGLSANLGPNTSALLNIRSGVTLRPTDTESFLYIQDLKNSDLTWEKLKEFNVGMDFELLSGKVTGTFDFYTRNSFDLIGLFQTSGVGGSGAGGQSTDSGNQTNNSGVGGNAFKNGNYADMKSHGFELAFNTVNLRTTNFTWMTSFNIGYSKDRITRLEFNPRLGDALVQKGAAVLNGPRRGLFSTKFAGLDYRGIPTYFDENGEIIYNYDLQERENLGDILKYEGPIEPRGAGGLSNIFNYKNFSLNVFLSFKFDYKIRLDDAFSPVYTDFNSLSRSFVNRWVVPGDEEFTDVPVILDKNIAFGDDADLTSAYDLYNKSTVRVADGTYVRLKSLRLSYSLPPAWGQKIRAKSAQLSIEAQNLMLLYSDKKLNGQDPEFFSAGGVALPQPRLITTSIILGF